MTELERVAAAIHTVNEDLGEGATLELAEDDAARKLIAALAAQGLAITGAPDAEGAGLDIESPNQPARLAAFLCQDAQNYGYDHGASPTMTGFDAPWPSCPRHQAIAANLFVRAAAPPSSVDGEGLRAAAQAVIESAIEYGSDDVFPAYPFGLFQAIENLRAALDASGSEGGE